MDAGAGERQDSGGDHSIMEDKQQQPTPVYVLSSGVGIAAEQW